MGETGIIVELGRVFRRVRRLIFFMVGKGAAIAEDREMFERWLVEA